MLTFERGAKYKRPDVKELAGLPREAQGGNWDTGVVEHENEFIIFTNIGTQGRTGHDYGNRWEGSCLRWYHKSSSHLGWPSVQKLLEPKRIVHVFWRNSNDAPFEYAGTARRVEVADTSPVEILWSFNASQVVESKTAHPKPPARHSWRLLRRSRPAGSCKRVREKPCGAPSVHQPPWIGMRGLWPAV